MTSIELRTLSGQPVVVVELTGEVDLATASAARTALQAGFDRAPSARTPVIIDCTRVTFLAICGVRTLLETRQRYRRDSRLATVGAPGGPLDRMVSLLGLGNAVAVYPTVTDAARAK